MARRRTRNQTPPLKFDRKLALNQWMLSLFYPDCDIDKLPVDGFRLLADPLKDPDLEGFDEKNVSHFHHALVHRLWQSPHLSKDMLEQYDQNIVRHWKRIAEKRHLDGGHRLFPKYFQYLSLLFTEIYLDRYFADPEQLLKDLNAHVAVFNAEVAKTQSDKIDEFVLDDLNKLAFWSATGSGKTLLMHCNILQYRHYLKMHKREHELNRVILLTPNEGLSNQHLEEFDLSGIEADIFQKEGRQLFQGHAVEIIDIHKLREKSGDKTVAVEAFEGNNLVLVDEGHRGTSKSSKNNEDLELVVGEWFKRRAQLCEQGFSFEYSATFGQAVKASGSRHFEQIYAKCILFDYSYKYFYGDGYGKEYRILNLEEGTTEDKRMLYLTAGLLTFFQQQKLFHDKQNEFRPYLIEKPLWIFVGGSVTAKVVKTVSGQKVSDVVDILLFLSSFLANRTESVKRIEALLKGVSGLLDKRDQEIFANSFTHLNKEEMTAEQVFDEIIGTLFNAETKGMIHVEHLKGSNGEIVLRLGDSEPFGLISVGDAPELCKLCEEHPDSLAVTERDFSGSYFGQINHENSNINLLIGSRKFSEGWSSWRVSCMGLMNIGKTEGAQIIQLFGRGVRLKGKDFSLKRSSRIDNITPPDTLPMMETLNIFGLKADYMTQFKEYLEEEGLPPNDDLIEFTLPVMPTIKNLGSKRLRTIKLQDGTDFKRNGPKPELAIPEGDMAKQKVVLDWYPKIQTLIAPGAQKQGDSVKEEGKLNKKHVAFMNLDEIWFSLVQFKNERSWYNFNLSRTAMVDLLNRNDWYTLFIPNEDLECRRFDQVQVWQEIAVALLKKYCDRLYGYKKSEYEKDFLEYRFLDENDPNFIEEYRIMIDRSLEEIVDKLEELKGLVESGELSEWNFQKIFFASHFSQHLYQPVLHIKSDFIESKPVSLNMGEKRFVDDLKRFYEGNERFFEGKELYLLRNLSRGKGVGFFEAGSFYPDYILWLLDGDRQFISFVDPKGLRNIDGMQSPKIQFYKTIKELEERLADPEVILNSFIVSNTPFPQVSWWEKSWDMQDFNKRHIFFQEEQNNTYVQKIFDTILGSCMSNIQ